MISYFLYSRPRALVIFSTSETIFDAPRTFEFSGFHNRVIIVIIHSRSPPHESHYNTSWVRISKRWCLGGRIYIIGRWFEIGLSVALSIDGGRTARFRSADPGP